MRKFATIIGLFTASIMLAGLIGCGALNPIESNISISVDPIGSIQAGQNKAVTGTITSDTIISKVEYTIEDKDGNAVTTGITTQAQTINTKSSINLKDDATLVIQTTSAAVAGDYKLVITVTSGAAEQTQKVDFSVTGGSTGGLTTDTVTLGNTQNTTAGTIDLDNGSTFKATEVTSSNVGDIDLCYANGSGADRFYVPEAAKFGTTDNKTIKTTAAGFTFTNDWPTSGYSATVRINTITAAQFDATTSQTAAAALWSASNAVVFAPVNAVGDCFLVKTSKDAYVLIKVLSLTAGITGTVEFKYAK